MTTNHPDTVHFPNVKFNMDMEKRPVDYPDILNNPDWAFAGAITLETKYMEQDGTINHSCFHNAVTPMDIMAHIHNAILAAEPGEMVIMHLFKAPSAEGGDPLTIDPKWTGGGTGEAA